MTYREKVQNEINNEKLIKLSEKICEAYEQGGVEQVKSTIDGRLDTINRDYQEVIKKLGELL